jgi:predicted enzyme related to lactoylglutathione lyase
MGQTMVGRLNRPVWVDLSSSDPAGSRDFYAKLFAWDVEVNEDPQYGGYALARIGGKDVAGIGPKMQAEAPTAWTVYIGTDDADALGRRVEAAGGTVVAPAFDVGDQGRMAVFQDPAGAIISAWQTANMSGFQTDAPGAFGWAELSSRDMSRAIPFYESVFGWTTRTTPMGEGQPDYTQFQLDGESVAGGMAISPGLPAEVPSYWMIYFDVDSVEDSFRRAVEAGASEMVAPSDFPGGRFAILTDPQGAMFGLLKTS